MNTHRQEIGPEILMESTHHWGRAVTAMLIQSPLNIGKRQRWRAGAGFQ